MKLEKRLVIFEIIATLVSLIIFISIVCSIIIEENKNRNDAKILEEYLNGEPIQEEATLAVETTEVINKSATVERCYYLESVIEETTIETNPYEEILLNLTDYEKEIICKITFAEAGNQDEDGQRAVIEVILNRVLSDSFPNTVEGVLSQSGQFSTWKRRNHIKKENHEPILEIIDMILVEEPVLPSVEYVFFATSKHTKYATNYIKIQDHWFGTQY